MTVRRAELEFKIQTNHAFRRERVLRKSEGFQNLYLHEHYFTQATFTLNEYYVYVLVLNALDECTDTTRRRDATRYVRVYA